MKQLILFIALTFYAAAGYAQEGVDITDEQKALAVKVAVNWTTELIKGENMDKVLEATTLPFVLDGRKVLTTSQELKDFCNKVLKEKGKRKVPQIKSEVLTVRNEILEDCIPLLYAVVAVDVTLDAKTERILISVSMAGDKYKVAGFKD